MSRLRRFIEFEKSLLEEFGAVEPGVLGGCGAVTAA